MNILIPTQVEALLCDARRDEHVRVVVEELRDGGFLGGLLHPRIAALPDEALDAQLWGRLKSDADGVHGAPRQLG